MEVLRALFAIAGLLVCCVGLAVAGGVAVAGVRRGGVLLGVMMGLWWVPAICASLALLEGDAAVVALYLGLWGVGLPVVFGAGFWRSSTGLGARRATFAGRAPRRPPGP